MRLVIDLTEDGYVSLGSTERLAVDEAKRAVLGVLDDGSALTRKEIALATGLAETTIKQAISELRPDFLEASGRGVKGDPERFARKVPATAEIHSGAPRGRAPDRMNSAARHGHPTQNPFAEVLMPETTA